MLDEKALGRSLRAAREARGLSQESVAQALDVPRTAVSNMENGTRSVSTPELAMLADLFRRSLTSLLEPERENAEDLSVVLPRAVPAMKNSPQLKDAMESVLQLCKEGARLRDLLDLTADSVLPNYHVRLNNTGDAIRQAETVAIEERRRLGLGTAPVGDLSELISSQGIWTAAADLGDDLSGLFIRDPSVGSAIIIHIYHPVVRKRFSYAHEYAHALFDSDKHVMTTERSNASDLIEKRANAFAAAFLMPSEGIADQLRQLDKGNPSRLAQILFSVAEDDATEAEIRPPAGSQSITYQDVTVLARHFGVSYDAMVWRLRSLNRLNTAETSMLQNQREYARQYGQLLGFINDEEGLTENNLDNRQQELISQVARLTFEAYRRDLISPGKVRDIADMLNFNADRFIGLAESTVTD